MVEAAGIEPVHSVMRRRWARDCRCLGSILRESVAPSSPLESTAVPGSPPQSWRHFGDGARTWFQVRRFDACFALAI